MPEFLRLNSWLPKTMWGQLVFLLMLALIVSQAVTLMVFIESRATLNNSVAEEKLIAHIVQVMNRYEQEADGKRPSNDFLQSASTKELRFRPGRFAALKPNLHPKYTTRLHELISARLTKKPMMMSIISPGAQGEVFSSEIIPDNLTISIQVSPDFWVLIDREQQKPSYDWIWPLVMTMALMMVFIVLIISWVVRRLTKPLSALADAAQELGMGRTVGVLEETGTEDIRRATRAFNEMNQKIQRFVGDRTKLLAAISHDLRTPITSLLFRTEFIQDKEMQAKFFETLEEMRALTEATLNFSNDSNEAEQTRNTDLKSILETLVDDYLDVGKKIALDSADDAPQIVLPLRVQSAKRALRNFIDNGLKYGNQVTMAFAHNVPENSAEIYIRDCGPGIDEDQFEQVFEPFYRLEKSRNRDTGGVGLGLSIAREIVRGHGGEVVLSNITAEGAITGLQVKIILPLK